MKMKHSRIYSLVLNNEQIDIFSTEIKRYLLTHLNGLKRDKFKTLKLVITFDEEFYK